MATTKTEYLSALLDDEAGEFEQRRMLDELQGDTEMRTTFSHYSLIGEAIRSESPVTAVKGDFLSGLHDLLEDEPEYGDVRISETVSAKTSRPTWLRPVAGFAVAASFAAVAVIGMQNFMGSTEEPKVIAELGTTGTTSNAPRIARTDNMLATVPAATQSWQSNQAMKARLKRYVSTHARYGSTSPLLPSVRAASYSVEH